MTEFDIISDHSKQKLSRVPDNVLKMYNLKMLYLEGNLIEYLPDDFFQKLEKLTWLDLRNNKLRYIPKNIAYHENLENLLLSKNYIERLPNELGVIPKLKVLQVSHNPLVYPCRSIITDGIQTITTFLRKQFLIENCKGEDAVTELKSDSERLNNTIRSSWTTLSNDKSNEKILIELDEKKNKTTNKTAGKKSKSIKPNAPQIITITNLSKQSVFDETTNNVPSIKNIEGDVSIIHEMTKGESELNLKSYYENNTRKIKGNYQLTNLDMNLKDQWLNKIKCILSEQERIIQQEKNLLTLKEWREERKRDTIKTVDSKNLFNPPFDVQDEYMTMVSRKDLLNSGEKNYVQKGINTFSEINMEDLIAELVSQLQELEEKYFDVKSPKHEREESEKQIKKIMEIHHKIQTLQSANDKYLSSIMK